MISFAARRRAHLELGRRGEDLAASYLENRGWEIFARNWQTGAGELDIVAWDGDLLHFVEVKTLRVKENFSPIRNLSGHQRHRNFCAGKVYLASIESGHFTAGYDLAVVMYSQQDRLLSFEFFEDYLPRVETSPMPYEVSRERVEEEKRPAGGREKLLMRLNLLPCPFCGTGLGDGKGGICPDCLEELDFLPFLKNGCPGCGGPQDGVLELCSHCLAEKRTPFWEGIISLFEHRDLGRQIISELKFSGRSELARILGRLGAQAVRRAGFEADCVISVPLHLLRHIRRTYNQSALFGRFTARYLGIPQEDCLKRVKSGRRQASLGRSGRLKNLRSAFVCIHPEKITGKRILLVDDVFTTGSTLTAAARVLMKHKPAAIYVLTIARRKTLFRKRQ